MRRLARHAFTALSALSLLLCVAVCVLWVDSYSTGPSIENRELFWITRSDPQYWFVTNPGRLTLCQSVGKKRETWLESFSLWGIEFGGLSGDDGSLLWNLVVPYWMLATITALPMPVWMWTWRRRRHAERLAHVGRCASCGYDLRASPGRCPECGTEGPQADGLKKT